MKGRTYRYFDDPLFAFGYGLSYTNFTIGEGKIKKDGKDHILTLPVSNTGSRDGAEVVQVYIRDLSDPDGPLKSLRAFQRVPLKAGESKTISLTLTPASFEFFDPNTNTVHTKQGKFEILYGNSSRNQDLKSLQLTIK